MGNYNYKNAVNHLVKELNTVGSRATLHGKNNHVKACWNDAGYYLLYIEDRQVGIAMKPKECCIVLEALCSIL